MRRGDFGPDDHAVVVDVGVKVLAWRADELAKKHGERFAPPRLLRDKAAKGEALA